MSNSVTFRFDINISVPDSVGVQVPVQVSFSCGQPILTSEWEAQQKLAKEQEEQQQGIWAWQKQVQEHRQMRQEAYQREQEAIQRDKEESINHDWKIEGF